MAAFLQTLTEFNKLLRTLAVCAIVAALGYAGMWVYDNVVPSGQLKQKEEQLVELQTALQSAQDRIANQDAAIGRLHRDLEQATAEIARLDTSLRLLKVDHRVAELEVLHQYQDPETNRTVSEIAFQEVDDQGNPIDSPKRLAIEGDLVYLDYWVVKFDDQYIERADVDRSTSICLFRRIFGEYQEPQHGYTLDQVGVRPSAYGSGPMSEFEEQIWSDFWNIAQNPQRAEALGIRAAHGEAVSTKLRPEGRYRVTLRASGGLTIQPITP